MQFNADYTVTPSLTFTSQTGFNHDFLYSTEDYNRFNTTPGLFINTRTRRDGAFCDPQLGCSTRLLAQDVSDEHAWQANQEFRLTSNFSGPFNFSAGGNYMHYETEENYYVFINALTLIAEDLTGIPANPDNSCVTSGGTTGHGYQFPNIANAREWRRAHKINALVIDFNPLSSVNNQGHNYFLSQNPYMLNSYAVFGETYYNILNDLKADRRPALDRRPEAFYRYSQRSWHQWSWLSQHRRCESAMGSIHRSCSHQLDTQTRFHRSDPDLWILCSWLQGGWRKSAGRCV